MELPNSFYNVKRFLYTVLSLSHFIELGKNLQMINMIVIFPGAEAQNLGFHNLFF